MLWQKRKKGIPGLSFSLKRATGITSAKQKIAKATGIPTTKSGRQKKVGRIFGIKGGAYMKIEPLPSGSYRIRKMYKGQTYTIVTDYKPTQKEALQLMAAELDKVKTDKRRMTFKQAADSYLEMKSNVLSPSTLRGYHSVNRCIYEEFSGILLSDMDTAKIQRYINQISVDKKPKTVSNYMGFISAVLGFFCPNLKICVTLPQKSNDVPYIPSSEDIKKILEKISGTDFEVPVLLGCYGLRRSEICALTVEDLEGDVLHINKALVQDEKNQWILRHNNKTDTSTRDIVIPVELADLIRQQGYVFQGHPGMITKRLEAVEAEIGLENFSLHKLRHYFASQMSSLGISEVDILHLGGWKTDRVMKTVYRHSMMAKEENAKREASEMLKKQLF